MALTPRHDYDVLVSNIGYVYHGQSYDEAHAVFVEYLALTKLLAGRASGETVTMIRDDDTILHEWDASQFPPHAPVPAIDEWNPKTEWFLGTHEVWFQHVYYGGDTRNQVFPIRTFGAYDDLRVVARAHVVGGPQGGGLL